jgi:hypothetical protein
MASFLQTFYVSRATTAFDGAAIESILQVSRRHNTRSGLTGCLLFSGHCFAQVLEGPQASVRALARKIAADPRHTAVRFLTEVLGEEREYADWPMGYLHDVSIEDDLETLLMIPERSRAVAADVMERMRPDPVMGALR